METLESHKAYKETESMELWLIPMPLSPRTVAPYINGRQAVEEWNANGVGELTLMPTKLAGMSLFYCPCSQWRTAKLHYAHQTPFPQSIDQVLVVHDLTEEGGSVMGFFDGAGMENGWWCYIETIHIRSRINELLAESCRLRCKRINKAEDVYWRCIDAAVKGMKEIVGIELRGELGELPQLNIENGEEPGSTRSQRSSTVATPTRYCPPRRRSSATVPWPGASWLSIDMKPLPDLNVSQDPFTA